jgi:hypothetical protein
MFLEFPVKLSVLSVLEELIEKARRVECQIANELDKLDANENLIQSLNDEV